MSRRRRILVHCMHGFSELATLETADSSFSASIATSREVHGCEFSSPAVGHKTPCLHRSTTDISAISNGKVPHVHSWRRDPLNLVHVPPEQWTLDLPARDIYAMSSFDNITTVGECPPPNIWPF